MIELKDFPKRNQIKSEDGMIYNINFPAKVKFREDYIERTRPLVEELSTIHICTDKTLYEKEIQRESLRAQVKEEKRKFDKEFRKNFPLPAWVVDIESYDYGYFGNKYERG